MNTINKYFVFIQLVVQTLSVGSYTVVLKQVKPLYPSVKVYRYELRHGKVLPQSNDQLIYSKPLLGQRIYPVVVKPGRDVHFKTRVPVKKEKGKLYKVSSTTEKPILRDPRFLGLSQHLVPPLSNLVEEHSEAKEEEAREEENDIRPLLSSPHSSKSFSSFGQDKERIYNNPGDWTTPTPQVNSENGSKSEFTPSQLYLQIRHKNTVIHVPQTEALKDAETLEELINAPRLKELSRTTHVQETYSEEGYEDAAYDHAGHLRQAQHGEIYDAKNEGRFKIKEAPVILNDDSDLEETKKVPLKNANDHLLLAEGNLNNKLEPRTTRSRSEISKTSVEYAKTPKNYKGEHRYSSRVKSPIKTFHANESQLSSTNIKEFPTAQVTFPSYFEKMAPASESIIANDSTVSYKPPVKKSSKYRKGDFNSTKIFPISESLPSEAPPPVNEYTDFKPYISLIDSQASPSAKSLKYSRIYSKKTKQLRLEPYKNENIYSPPPPPPPPPLPSALSNSELSLRDDSQSPQLRDKTEEEESVNQRIVLPTIGYINSLTTAHFGKESPKLMQEESKSQLTDALNLTQALKYLRSNKNQQNLEVAKSPTEIDIRTFEPMKLKRPRSDGRRFVNKTKRDVYLTETRGKRSDIKVEVDDGNDESDLPHNEKNEEIAEDERKRIEEENREKEKYEEDLKSEISKQEKEILKETFRNIGVEGDVFEVFPEFPFSDSKVDSSSLPLETTTTPVNIRKYPFYKSKRLPENSALRYATDPKQFPKKSGYKMEFYESREQLIQCPDFHPDLENLPDSNSTEFSEEQAGENQRLSGLGNKIACLRMKYFDPEPFDNPIFKEREIDYVGKPEKGRIKAQKTKILPKTPGLKKRDQTLQQTSYQKFSEGESKKQKLNEKLPAANFNKSPQTSYLGQATTSQQIKNRSAETSKMFAHQKSHLKANKSRKIPAIQEIHNKSVPSLPVVWKTGYRSKHPPNIGSKPETRNRIVKSHNCLPHFSQLVVLDGINNVTIDCSDVILIQEIRGNIPYLKIIPKDKKTKKEKRDEKISAQPLLDETDWVPIVGYTLSKYSNRLGKPLSRRTDEVTKLRNETGQNTSSAAHYVIDELKEDENVRKGEVVEDMAHYLKLMENFKNGIKEITTVKTELKAGNSTRKKREAQNEHTKPIKENNFSKTLEFSLNKALQTQSSSKGDTDKTLDEPSPSTSRPFERKRPLKRLSGLDFLVRYHKNKGKNSAQRAEDFWKITTRGPVAGKNDHKFQKKTTDIDMRASSRNAEYKVEKTTVSQTVETTTKYFVRETSEFRKRQTNSSSEKFNKPKGRQTNDPRKISPSNLIPEKLTKRPANKTSEILKITTQNSVSEKTTTKPVNFTKIITKVSTETSETSEKPRIVYKQTTLHSNQSFNGEISSEEPEVPQYKSNNRSSTSVRNKDSEHLSRSSESPEGPTLYYVVNLKTGKGKWITHYDEKLLALGKHQKPQRVKEISGTKKDKRRKKTKN